MDKVGPICRAVEDCAIVLDAIRGPDGKDLSVVDEPFDWTPEAPLSKLRVGISKPEFDNSPENAKPLYEAALKVLEKLGVKPEPVEFPTTAADAIRIVLVAEAAAQFDDITREGAVERMRGQNTGDWPNTFRVSRLIPAVEYIRAQRARTLLMRSMAELTSRYDVVVCPFGRNLTVTNLTGHPQVVVPCGFIGDQPRGLLLTGRLFEEGTPLRLALAYQQATDWHLKHPKMDWA
jgi:Asp-tRNA(Asn)/Glu-tRNA(Gln) amidotransferase A subunit family amidase